MDIEVVSYPGATAWQQIITLTGLKMTTHILHSALDTEIERCARAAVSFFDGPNGVLNRSVLPYTWRMYRPGWPCNGVMRLPFPPVRTVTSVKYRDSAGAEQTLASSAYVVRKPPAVPAEIVAISPNDLPGIEEHPRAVTIEFTAGYGTAAGEEPVPDVLKQGVSFMAGHYLENPEATINEPRLILINRQVDLGVQHVIALLRVQYDRRDWQ